MMGLLNAVFFAFLSGAHGAPSCPVPEYIDFQVESVVERKPAGFTQGLEIHDGVFYESTGAYKDTTKINRISMDGKVETLIDHGDKKEAGQPVFGEGMTILNGKIYQLTYKNRLAYVYDLNGKVLKTLPSPLKEGWGLANDGTRLIASDGSDQLSFHDPENLGKFTKVGVRDERGPVDGLNELEFVNGKVYANIFGSNEIVRIDPETGCVEARADMTNLVKQIPKPHGNPLLEDRNFVLNGIAFDQGSDKFYLTGKNWPVLFKTRLVKTTPPKKPALPGLPGGLKPLQPGNPGSGCNPSLGPCGKPGQK